LISIVGHPVIQRLFMKIDIGCGLSKRPGFVGVDISPLLGVDHVVDIEREPLPFPDNSVEQVYCSHCLEHLSNLNNALSEIGRVCKNNATIEICVPYGHHNDAHLLGHNISHTEELWYRFSTLNADFWYHVLNGRWRWQEIRYVITEDVLTDLDRHNVSTEFAIRYFNNVIKEMVMVFSYTSEVTAQRFFPARYFSTRREGPRQLLSQALPLEAVDGAGDFVARSIEIEHLRRD
jgi:SAM-dependent methyltransferase